MRHSNSKYPPVLFVPGSFCGAWIWKGNFFEYFHEAGYDVAAMSFGVHARPGWDLWQRGLKEFDADLKMAISEFDTPPFLGAHSPRGLVAQRVPPIQTSDISRNEPYIPSEPNWKEVADDILSCLEGVRWVG